MRRSSVVRSSLRVRYDRRNHGQVAPTRRIDDHQGLYRVKTWFGLSSRVQEGAAASISQELDRNDYSCLSLLSCNSRNFFGKFVGRCVWGQRHWRVPAVTKLPLSTPVLFQRPPQPARDSQALATAFHQSPASPGRLRSCKLFAASTLSMAARSTSRGGSSRERLRTATTLTPRR